MESMAFAFRVKPGKAQEWRDWGREFRGALRKEYLAFRRRWGLMVNRLYFQHTPLGDQAVFYLEGYDLQRAFQYLRCAQGPFAAWLRQYTLDLFEGFDLTQPSLEALSVLAFDAQSLEDDEARDSTVGRLVHEAHTSHDSPVRGILQSRVGSMMILRLLAVIFGVALIVLVTLDAFETIVLPRRVTWRIRLALIYYRSARLGWVALSRLFRSGSRRDAFLGYVGPLSLLGLLLFWAVLFVFGFALLLWGPALPLNAPGQPIGFPTYLYLSGTTFFTLGLGDVTPLSGLGRFLLVSEVAFGFVFLALVICYVPVLYQAFSRRELRISLLDARAGFSPTAVELLRRNGAGTHPEELRTLLHEWEVWCADILESHLSSPLLAYYRSQHEQQSWVEALTVILDTYALILTSLGVPPLPAARYTFAAARHAVVDLAQVLGASPIPGVNRLSTDEWTQVRDRLAAVGIPLKEDVASEKKLAKLRETYEPFVSGLARRIQVALPPWIPPEDALDDWQTSAWDEQFPSILHTLKQVLGPTINEIHSEASTNDFPRRLDR